MKSTVLVLALALGLGACQKSTVDPQLPAPDFAVDFDKDFALHYRQQAFLPGTGSRELTIQLEDLNTTYCPEGLQCAVGPSAWPVLAITDAQGQSQQLRLPDGPQRSALGAWLDTTSIRANGRRYLLTYTVWDIDKQPEKGKMPALQDWALWFNVTKTPR
ncbi:hypothetical protein [Hymenobacter chitinivorans]|uniref:Lipoprotein n=1 Tax=Hymenobacter chitinivorans DSM 11115 TaxID=1121954 RepID=A0A2M9BSI6_9BACT|nr:hypothetical protein [Hymenobacter chitinivorans]PJJ60908.1 hypothetical protein CLV45_2343 [Hymenobacter chitinivorans DSM 11115]